MRFPAVCICMLLLWACKKENPKPSGSDGGGQGALSPPPELSSKKVKSSRSVRTGDTLFFYKQIQNNKFYYDTLGRLVAIQVTDSSKFNLVSDWEHDYYTQEFEYNTMGLISTIRYPFQSQMIEIRFNYNGSLLASQISQYTNTFDTIVFEHKNGRIIGRNHRTDTRYYYSGNLDSTVSNNNGQWYSTIRYIYNNRADLTWPLGRQKAMGKTFCPMNLERTQEISRSAANSYTNVISRVYNTEGLPVKKTEGSVVTTYEYE